MPFEVAVAVRLLVAGLSPAHASLDQVPAAQEYPGWVGDARDQGSYASQFSSSPAAWTAWRATALACATAWCRHAIIVPLPSCAR
jgi:hypothetical protein